jgi:uncharacterized protein
MHIRITDLSKGIHRQSLQEPASSLGLEEEDLHFTKPVGVQFTLQKVADQIVCQARVKAIMELECSRCLESVEQEISGEMTILLTFSQEPSPEEAEHEVKIVPPGAKEVDVSEEIRQTILLAIPGKPLCRTDCRGLCPHCGTNLNHSGCQCQVKVEDPRWSGLQKLFSNKSKGEGSGCS